MRSADFVSSSKGFDNNKKKNNRLYTGLSNVKDKRIFELDCLSD